MKTERARELYTDYAEGALSPALAQALEQHFEADADARADYDQFQRVYALLDTTSAEEAEVPLGFRAKVLEMAAQEQARRDAMPARRAALSMTGWFRSFGDLRPRRASLGVAAALVVAALAGVAVHQVSPTNNGSLAGFGPYAATTIRTVTVQPAGQAGATHLFHIHLPADVPQATVTAQVITDIDQITDPVERQQQAINALDTPKTLTNDEELQIPVTLRSLAPAGATLNLLVEWTPADSRLAPGMQVVFEPLQVGVAPNKVPGVPPISGNFYDALQALSAQYGVTVVADATATPNVNVTPPPAGADAAVALASVVQQAGYHVRQLNRATFQVYVR